MNIDYKFIRDIVVDGVRTQGKDKNLGPTEVALINMDKPSLKGYDVLDSLKGVGRDSILKIVWGNINKEVDKTNTNKNYGTIPFRKGDVKDLRVEVPQSATLQGDVWILGFNGKKGTGITMETNSGLQFGMTLSGETLEAHAVPKGEYEVNLNIFAPRELPSDDNFVTGITYPSSLEARTNHEIVEQAVEKLKNRPVYNGFKVSDFVDVKLVTSIESKPITSGQMAKVRIVVPLGDQGLSELTKIQSKYPELSLEYDGSIVLPNSAVYKSNLVDKTIADGLGAFDYVRSITMKYDCPTCEEDPKEDSFLYILRGKGVADADLSTITETVVRDETLTTENELYITSTEYVDFTAFIQAFPSEDLEISNPHLVRDKCIDSTEITTTIQPEVIEVYDIVVQKMTMVLPDDSCGNNRLSELQKYYGENVNLSVEVSELPCMHIYTAEVKGAPIQDTCGGKINDTFYEVELKGYDNAEWKLVNDTVYKEDTEVGIRLEGKTIQMGSDSPYEDNTPFIVGFTKIKAWMSDENNGYRTYENVSTNQPQQVTFVRRGEKPDGMGYEFFGDIASSQYYFTGGNRDYGKGYYNSINGYKFPLNPFAQYICYYLRIEKTNSEPFSGGWGDRVNYRFIAEMGQQEEIEKLLNSIASGVGLDQVKSL